MGHYGFMERKKQTVKIRWVSTGKTLTQKIRYTLDSKYVNNEGDFAPLGMSTEARKSFLNLSTDGMWNLVPFLVPKSESGSMEVAGAEKNSRWRMFSSGPI